jgi:hypothetical protein
MKRPREVIQSRWGVYALRKKAEKLGSVTAKDEIEAVQRAFKEFDVAERERWRVSVQRES